MSPSHHSGALNSPLPALCPDASPKAEKADDASSDTGSTGDEEGGFAQVNTMSSDDEGNDNLDSSDDNADPTTSTEEEERQNCCVVDEDVKVQMPSKGIFSSHERRACIGFLAQYFAVGVIYSGVPATTYGVFLGYLNVPGYVYATVSVISSLPWSFKFFFGLINDTVPIFGLRRKPYMVLGWLFCAGALLKLGMTPLPPPYWCQDEAGLYIKKQTLPDGTIDAAEPCNPSAAEEGGKYAILLMLAALGYVIADVAADGLTTEYAKQEPIERRGNTQTTAYLTRTIGGACTTLFIGLCMNSHEYNGSFSWGISFETVSLVLAVPAVLMVPITIFCVKEPRDPSKTLPTGREYMSMCWELLKSKACFYIIIYAFLSSAIGNISSPAGGNVKIYWAGVENLQNQLFSLVGLLLFAQGLWLVKKYFLQTSWRVLLTVTLVFLQCVDSVFTTCTIFDVIRNQYFYLGETVLLELPLAANFVVGTFVIVEMADDGNEGMVYGLLTTTMNLGNPVARAIGNQIYGLFTPSLSDARNYIRDEPSFRLTVFYSFLLNYMFPILSLVAIWHFLPDQKADTQERKKNWNKRPIYGIITLVLLSVSFAYSLTVNFMAMSPETMCLKFAGGDGCDGD